VPGLEIGQVRFVGVLTADARQLDDYLDQARPVDTYDAHRKFRRAAGFERHLMCTAVIAAESLADVGYSGCNVMTGHNKPPGGELIDYPRGQQGPSPEHVPSPEQRSPCEKGRYSAAATADYSTNSARVARSTVTPVFFALLSTKPYGKDPTFIRAE
jgi:hypothetical protein